MSKYRDYYRDEDGTVRPEPLLKMTVAENAKDHKVEIVGKPEGNYLVRRVVIDMEPHASNVRVEYFEVKDGKVVKDLTTLNVPVHVVEFELRDVEFSGLITHKTRERKLTPEEVADLRKQGVSINAAFVGEGK